MNGILNKGGRIVVDQIFEAGRKALAQLIEIGPDQTGGFDCIGAGSEIYPYADCGTAVDARFNVLVLRAELDASDVANAQQGAVGVGSQYDIAELVRGREPPLRLHVHL